MVGSSDESIALTRQRSEFLFMEHPHQPNKMENKKDLQKGKPEHELAINKVGITNLELPIKVNFNSKTVHAQAKISALVDLSSEKRGTHMSRLITILTEESEKTLTFKQIDDILTRIKKELEAEHSYLDFEFTIFHKKKSPITKKEGYVNYKCSINAEKNLKTTISLGAEVLVTSLCPISKEISDYSAHNQRGRLVVKALCKNDKVWFDQIISDVEKCGSCELYSVLKREDEKYVTEKAYENPKIVEDIVRQMAVTLMKNKNIVKLNISCENEESIHLHNAFSEITMKNG